MARSPRLRGLISYPKCGRTWIRLFLKCYQEQTKEKLRVKFREEHFEAQKRVLLIRNPCDVMVSYFFHRTVRRNMRINMSDFIKNKDFGLPNFNKRMKEWENYPNQIIAQYENLFGLKEWIKMFRHWEIKVSKTAAKKAHKKTEFKNIRKTLPRFGIKEYGAWRYLPMERGKTVKEPKNPEAHKFRRGLIGGYVDYLSQEDIDYIKENFYLPSPYREKYIGFISNHPSKK